MKGKIKEGGFIGKSVIGTAQKNSKNMETIPVSLTCSSLSFTGGDWEIVEKFNLKEKRFVVHGFGCKNWSEIVGSEKELKVLIKKYKDNDSWTGEIVAFELKPKYHVKRTSAIKKV